MRRQYLLAQSNRTAPSQTFQSNGFDLHCARTLTAWRTAKKDRARAREKDKENEGSGGVGVGGYRFDGSGSGSDVPNNVYEKRQGGGFGLGFGGLSSSSGSRGSSAAASAAAAAGGGGYGGDSLLDDGIIRDVDSTSSSSNVPAGGGGRSAFGGGLGFNFAAKPQASASSPDANTATTATASVLDDAIASGMLPDSFSGTSETVSIPPVLPKPTTKPAVKNMLDMY